MKSFDSRSRSVTSMTNTNKSNSIRYQSRNVSANVMKKNALSQSRCSSKSIENDSIFI